MKKTINITLNALVFNIEEDAYERLNSYLEGLKRHFGNQQFGMEIVNDIESRIAEQFSAKMHQRKSEAVNINQIEEVIKSMGTLEDLAGEGKKTEQEVPQSGKKRLYRNPDDQIVSGVSSGIASYFDIDPIIPRILFVIGTLTGGWAIILYIIMWVIIPEAKSGAEKLEMKGDAVTIANLEENRKEQKDPGKVSMVRHFLQELIYLMGRFFRALGPIIMSIVGIVLSAVAFVAVFAITLFAIILIFNPHSPYIDPTVTEIFNGAKYTLVILGAYLGLIVPALIALIIGVSFVRRRNLFTTSTTLAFVFLWLAGALTFGFMAARAAPQIEAAVRNLEEQPGITREFQVDGFDSIVAERDQRIKISYGAKFKVTATGTENDINRMQIQSRNGKLFIIQDNDDFRICFVCFNRPLSVEITMPDLNTVNANNSARIEILDFPKFDKLTLLGAGASRFDFIGDAENLELELSNASRGFFSGTATNVSADLSNAANLSASEFVIQNLVLKAKNASRAELNVANSIDISATNAAKINYQGNPKEEKLEMDNAARITEE